MPLASSQLTSRSTIDRRLLPMARVTYLRAATSMNLADAILDVIQQEHPAGLVHADHDRPVQIGAKRGQIFSVVAIISRPCDGVNSARASHLADTKVAVVRQVNVTQRIYRYSLGVADHS